SSGFGARNIASVTGTKFGTVFWVLVGTSSVGACAWASTRTLTAHNSAALNSNSQIAYLIALPFLGFKLTVLRRWLRACATLGRAEHSLRLQRNLASCP